MSVQLASKPIGLWPIVMMTLLSVGLVNHVIVVPLLLAEAKRDAWLSIPVALIIALPIAVFPLQRVMHKMNRVPFDEWLKQHIPGFFAWLILAIINLALLFVAIGTLVDVVAWTSNTYLPETPQMVVLFIFCFLCMFAALNGLRTIAYVSCILLPIVVVLGDFVMSANMPAKDYRYLLPMFETGITPIFKGAMYSLSAFMELSFLLLIQHEMKKSFKKWHLLLLTIMIMLLTLGPTVGAITLFGPNEASFMRYPAYSQWRLVKIGKYFEHVDFFAVFQWLSGALIRISLPLYLIQLYGPFRKLKHKWISMLITVLVIAVAGFVVLMKMKWYMVLMQGYFSVAWIIFGLILLLLWGLSFRKVKKKANPNAQGGYRNESGDDGSSPQTGSSG
ncbi:endospore germination permease [Paenibacillus glycanilyticus]|uniref:GerAB/ArcD/ProY family transporter n=1 Tax=Paenibacillus glycanilyticus TaxID=126569 RepID=UPI00203E0E4D|nr:endospore germination permease [Paenibacillus glycanilyticus]MCM3628972.1 endospore germination permease [Paenibacillus glycanilyticus]